MSRYHITAHGSTVGAIGALYTHTREFIVDASSHDDAVTSAIAQMHEKEKLEHVLVVKVTEIKEN